ncbi:hypothetical protein AB0D66_34050 [Streptomyces sp. NPDC048270]|uniref:hypothetical protein n=1 Tax=Streptomyces sp. NPDC048270 TaxID=3154615 RepID=UPI0033DDAB7E
MRETVGPGNIPGNYTALRDTFHAWLWETSGIDYSDFGRNFTSEQGMIEAGFMLQILADFQHNNHQLPIDHIYKELGCGPQQRPEIQNLLESAVDEYAQCLIQWTLDAQHLSAEKELAESDLMRKSKLAEYFTLNQAQIVINSRNLTSRLPSQSGAFLYIVRIDPAYARGIAALTEGTDIVWEYGSQLTGLGAADMSFTLHRSLKGLKILQNGGEVSHGLHRQLFAELFGEDWAPEPQKATRSAANGARGRKGCEGSSVVQDAGEYAAPGQDHHAEKHTETVITHGKRKNQDQETHRAEQAGAPVSDGEPKGLWARRLQVQARNLEVYKKYKRNRQNADGSPLPVTFAVYNGGTQYAIVALGTWKTSENCTYSGVLYALEQAGGPVSKARRFLRSRSVTREVWAGDLAVVSDDKSLNLDELRILLKAGKITDKRVVEVPSLPENDPHRI